MDTPHVVLRSALFINAILFDHAYFVRVCEVDNTPDKVATRPTAIRSNDGFDGAIRSDEGGVQDGAAVKR